MGLEQFAQTIFNWLPKLRKGDQTLVDAQAENDGALKVSVVKQVTAVTTWSDPAQGTPLTYQRAVAAAAKKLHLASLENTGGAKRWFMLFDLVAVPANGAQPVIAWPVPAEGVLIVPLPRPRAFATGVSWAISSTAGTLTVDAAALFRVHLELE